MVAVGSKYGIFFKAATNEVIVQKDGDIAPEGYVKIGDYMHQTPGVPLPPETRDSLGSCVNHVVYHHVQDALYARGLTDMSLIKITIDDVVNIL